MSPAIDPAADRAVYKQLADLIRTQIQNGEFRPGQRLPAQKDYIQEHWLSRATVDRAMNVLRHEGLIVTDRRGSRVRVRPETPATIVPLDRGKISARMPTDPERHQHGINEGIPVLVVTRDGQPEEMHPADRVEIHVVTQSDEHHGDDSGDSPLMPKAHAYQFDYLRRRDDTFFLGLKGPHGGIQPFPLTKEDMTGLIEAYLDARSAGTLGQPQTSLDGPQASVNVP
jgi:DNA-binding transcriptional regulator YhcF (GntR family)